MSSSKSFLERVSDICKSMDFLGPDFRFEKSSSAQFQSVSGFLFSSVCGIACIVMGMFFGKEVYEKKEPIINISAAFVEYSDIFMDEFPVMFAFFAANGTSLSLETINRYMRINNYEQTMDDKGVVKEIVDIYGFDNCTNVKFKKYEQMFKERINGTNPNLLCLDQKDKRLMFSNAYLALNSTNFNFVFKKCVDAGCPADTDAVIENMLITVIYPTSFVDIFNYKRPILTYFDEATTQASNYLKRRVYMRFIYNTFTDDTGVVFNNYVPQNFVQLLSVVPDDLLHPKTGPFKDILFWLALESPKISNLFSRKYMKISDLLAILGGTINSLYIILRVLSAHYLRFIYMDFLRHTVYDVIFDEAEKNRIKNEKLNLKKAEKIKKESKNNDFNSNSLLKENNLKNDRKRFDMNDISNISNINDLTPNSNNQRLDHNSKFNCLVDSEKGAKISSKSPDLDMERNVNVKKLNIANFIDQDLMEENLRKNQLSSRNHAVIEDDDKNNNSDKRLNVDGDVRTQMHKKSTTTKMDSIQGSSIDFLNQMSNKKDGGLDKYEGTKSEMDFRKKAFYNEMIIDTFKEDRVPEGYLNYIFSYLRCNTELSRIYEIRLKGIRKLMNINTYCKVITLQKEYSLDEESFVDL